MTKQDHYITIWTVESGDYSDYHIDAFFTNEEAAKQHAEQLQRHEGGCGSYEVRENNAFHQAPPTVVVWRTRWDGEPYSFIEYDWPDGSPFGAYTHRTPEEAIKAQQDRDAQAKAELEGLA
jgi:hypothetical protein